MTAPILLPASRKRFEGEGGAKLQLRGRLKVVSKNIFEKRIPNILHNTFCPIRNYSSLFFLRSVKAAISGGGRRGVCLPIYLHLFNHLFAKTLLNGP